MSQLPLSPITESGKNRLDVSTGSSMHSAPQAEMCTMILEQMWDNEAQSDL